MLGGNLNLCGSGLVNPIELTYESLKKVVRLAHRRIDNGHWTTLEGTSYLKEDAIKDALCSVIVEKAKNCCNLRMALDSVDSEPGQWETMNQDNTQSPQKYVAAGFPGVWDRDLPLSLYVDTPMHLLFLGIVKAVFIYVGIWSSRCGRRGVFQEIAKNRLLQLDCLNLSWLTFQVETFDTWGG